MTLLRSTSDLAQLRDCKRRLLAVFAHPDDESYGCAGAMARAAADPDTAVVLLCLTHGEASSGFEALTPKEIGALREERLQRVAAILGLDGLLLETLPDGRLARLPLDELARPVLDALSALEPDVVIAHDPKGVNGHADHIASHWAVRIALREHPGTRLAMVVYPEEISEAAKPRLLFPTGTAEIDVILELSEAEIDAKEACLRVHEALVTLRPDGPGRHIARPPREHFDWLDRDCTPPEQDLLD